MDGLKDLCLNRESLIVQRHHEGGIVALVLPFGTGADGGDGMYVLCTYVFMAVCTCIFPIIYVFILNGLSSNVSELNYWTKSIYPALRAGSWL